MTHPDPGEPPKSPDPAYSPNRTPPGNTPTPTSRPPTPRNAPTEESATSPDTLTPGQLLAEMIAPRGIHDREARERIWRVARPGPEELGESPWRSVLERALALQASQRYGTVRDLSRALEEVTLRIEGAEHKRPYPELSSFTAADAEFFFGREVEVEAVWKKLQRANLLAIIGSSGAVGESRHGRGMPPTDVHSRQGESEAGPSALPAPGAPGADAGATEEADESSQGPGQLRSVQLWG